MFSILYFMPVEINEPIKVAAVFSRGEIRPVWFAWKGRQIRIRETTFVWKTWEGSEAILHFSVTDGQGLYEIAYNKETMGWRMMNAEFGMRNEGHGQIEWRTKNHENGGTNAAGG